MSIKFGNPALEAYARAYTQKVSKKVQRIVTRTAHTIEDNAKGLAPVDEGQLRGSIESFVGGFTADVRVGAEHGIYVEFGTGIYATRGSRAKKIPWRFYSTKLNRWVTMYGMHPQPFWYPSIEIGRAFWISELSSL